MNVPGVSQSIVRLKKKIFFSDSTRYIVVSQCGFNLHFPDDHYAEHLLMSLLAIHRYPANVFSQVFSHFLKITEMFSFIIEL